MMIFCLVALAVVSSSYAADLIYIRSGSDSASTAQKQIQIAVNYYGLNLRVITENTDNGFIQKTIKEANTVGVVVHADTLSALQTKLLRQSMTRSGGGRIPLLIIGAKPDISPLILKKWLFGDDIRCKWIDKLANAYQEFGNDQGIMGQLSGIDIPFPDKNAIYIALGRHGRVQLLESIRYGNLNYPIFVVKRYQQQDVFVSSAQYEAKAATGREADTRFFIQIAPAMVFVRYCAGERGWHTLHHYANFTIDDPWLRQPYGYIDYAALLSEMEKHRFHTTIAFIPWNYDRSWSEVVSIFRNHQDKYSIAVHGDNHDHKEFTNYEIKSLDHQIANLKQALIRMDRFHDLTGITYDKVMIFPHSIAPEKTLEALKKYNYLATVNSMKSPMDSIPTASLADDLRTVTMSYAGFPSIQRISTSTPITEAYIAINQFLGNPLLFYNHSEYFSNGIDAFDSIVDRVNKREPRTEWIGLGDIVRHLYVVKLRDDSDYDVLAFSNNICLNNKSSHNNIYYIQKEESGGQVIGSVTVDGIIHKYIYKGGKISLSVPMPSGSTRCVSIQYANDLKSWFGGWEHDSVIVSLLRWGSDMRDIYLSKTRLGFAAIQFYDAHHITPKVVIFVVVFLFAAMLYAVYCLWRSFMVCYIKLKMLIAYYKSNT